MISLLILLVVVGLILYLVPMDARIKNIVYVVAVIIVIFFLLQLAGIHLPGVGRLP